MSPDRPLVAVLLGTDHHRFDRLVRWVEAAARVSELDWFVQHGTTPLPTPTPTGLSGAPLLSVTELTELLARASAVITHGGPGLIMDARMAGHTPIVVPRDPTFDEHVDGHQLRFTARIREAGWVGTADDQASLLAAVLQAVAAPRIVIESTNPSAAHVVAMFGLLVDDLVDHTGGMTRRRGFGRLA